MVYTEVVVREVCQNGLKLLLTLRHADGEVGLDTHEGGVVRVVRVAELQVSKALQAGYSPPWCRRLGEG